MQKLNFLLCALVLGATACTRIQPTATPIFDAAPIAGPCVLEADTVRIVMKDYFPTVAGIDSVRCRDLTLTALTDSPDMTVQIVRRPDCPSLTVMDVYSGGQRGSLPVFTRPRTGKGQVPFLTTTASERRSNRVGIVADHTPADYLIFWQNTLIAARYLEHRGEGKFFVTLPHAAAACPRSYLRVYAANKEGVGNDVLIPVDNGKPVTSTAQLNRHDMHAQVLYSLLLDRFYNGNKANDCRLNRPDVLPKVDYWGGDLAGVTEQLRRGYFDSLGVNTLWLSPITQNPYDAWGQNKDPRTKFSGYHGYWPIYVTRLDPRFGSPQELDTLLAVAHRMGHNVILDYVANHMHIHSPTLKAHPQWTTPSLTPDGRKNRELWDEFRLTTWFDDHIPSLNLEVDSICRPLTDSALFWMRQYDFDGFRHDATKHIPLNYWRMLTSKLLDSLPGRRLFQIGETYGSPALINTYVRTGLLNGQFDFNVYDTYCGCTTYAGAPFTRLDTVLRESLNTYGYHNLMGYITGNHDRARYVSLCGGDLKEGEDLKMAGWKRTIGVTDTLAYRKLSLLHALIATLPGLPCIYYGDEWGQPGANDPDNRRWAQFAPINPHEARVHAGLRNLLRMRATSLPLLYGDYKPLFADTHLLVYIRSYMGKWVLTALNKGPEKREVELALPAGLTDRKGKNRITVAVAPYDYTLEKNE